MKYFEDCHVGEKAELGRHTFTADEIKAFAKNFDPQPFHIDEAAAAHSHFGALCASGWHTASLWMKHAAAYRRREEEAQLARGEIISQRGPSPGFRDLKWPKPVFVGDTITFAMETAELKPLASRPGWGLVFSRNTAANQKGEIVLSFLGALFVERRSSAHGMTRP
jgi:acyl dehydratase